MTPWADKAFARQHWADAASIADAHLDTLLEVATEQCAAYAPTVAAGNAVPSGYALATVYQAREIYTAAQRGDASSDVIGFGEYAVRARPLASVVKQMLRPRRRVPSFGSGGRAATTPLEYLSLPYLVLGPDEPVPTGTPSGMLIFRRSE